MMVQQKVVGSRVILLSSHGELGLEVVKACHRTDWQNGGSVRDEGGDP